MRGAVATPARHPHPQRRRAGGGQRPGRGRGGRHAGAGDDQRLRRALRQRQPHLHHPRPAAEDGPALRARREPGPPDRAVAHGVSEIANLNPDAHAPYVGASAFAHKGGAHVAAVEKLAASYEHIAPELVGNRRKVVVSELSGRGNVRMRAVELGVDARGQEKEVLARVKDAGERGLPVRGRRGLVRAAGPPQPAGLPGRRSSCWTWWWSRSSAGGGPMFVEATVKLRVGGENVHTAAEGTGPGARAGPRVPQGAAAPLPAAGARCSWPTTRCASWIPRPPPGPTPAC